MNRRLPTLALLLGLAGLVPFLACAVLAVGGGDQADRAGFALNAYAAVILAFLGGVHWGFALVDSQPAGQASRIGLGVVPSLLGWVALLLDLSVNQEAGLGLLTASFVGTVIVESRAAAAGLVPRGYMALRYALSAVVGTILVLVLLMRLLGIHLRV